MKKIIITLVLFIFSLNNIYANFGKQTETTIKNNKGDNIELNSILLGDKELYNYNITSLAISDYYLNFYNNQDKYLKLYKLYLKNPEIFKNYGINDFLNEEQKGRIEKHFINFNNYFVSKTEKEKIALFEASLKNPFDLSKLSAINSNNVSEFIDFAISLQDLSQISFNSNKIVKIIKSGNKIISNYKNFKSASNIKKYFNENYKFIGPSDVKKDFDEYIYTYIGVPYTFSDDSLYSFNSTVKNQLSQSEGFKLAVNCAIINNNKNSYISNCLNQSFRNNLNQKSESDGIKPLINWGKLLNYLKSI